MTEPKTPEEWAAFQSKAMELLAPAPNKNAESPLLEIEPVMDLEISYKRSYCVHCRACNLRMEFSAEREVVTRWEVEEFPEKIKAAAIALGAQYRALIQSNEHEVAEALEHNKLAENIELDMHQQGLRELQRLGCPHATGPVQPAVQPGRVH